MKSYHKGTGKVELLDGHWLKKDRRKKSSNWSKANLFNLMQENGSVHYKSISQQRDFYKWCNALREEKGHEIKWLSTATEVTKRYALLESGFVRTFITNDKELNIFFSQYTQAIFQDVVPFLKKLILQKKPLKGKEAMDWDLNFLKREQCVVAPSYYNKQSQRIIDKFTRMSKGQGIYRIAVSRKLRFEGNLLNCEDRYKHGWEKIMQYQKLID